MNTIALFSAFNIHISLPSETLFTVWGLHVTNATLIGAFAGVVFLTVFLYVRFMVVHNKYNRFVGFMQWAFEGMLGQVDTIMGDKRLARKIAPYALTVFFFVLIGYWMSILPGLGSVEFRGAELIRSPAADINFTLAIMLITMIGVQFYAIRELGGWGNLKRYLRNPFKDPLGAFEGFLELIGEVSRGLALALRLFGNCFAGEILLIIIAVLTSYVSFAILPLFMAFELFIGLIQAYVFFVLTLIFTALAVQSHDHSPSAEPSGAVTQTE